MNVSGFTTINASTSQTISSNTKPAQYENGYHDGYASGLKFGIEFAIDRMLEIIEQIKSENNENNGEPSRTLLEIEYNDFRDRVLALNGGDK